MSPPNEIRARAVPPSFLAAEPAASAGSPPDPRFRTLAALVRRLPAGRRDVFLLRRVVGLTQHEIALHLHKPESEIEALLAATMHDCAAELARALPATPPGERSLT